MALSPIRITSAREQAREAIRSALSAGQYEPGRRLLETDLAEQLGISRVPVREALTSLVAENLLEKRHRSVLVPMLEANELHQLYLAREALELLLYKGAVSNIDDTCIKQLKAVQRKIRLAVGSAEAHTLEKLNRDFHFTIFEKASLPVIESMVSSIWDRTSYYRAYFWLSEERRLITVSEHQAIIEACRNRDLAELVRLNSNHRSEMKREDLPWYRPLE